MLLISLTGNFLDPFISTGTHSPTFLIEDFWVISGLFLDYFWVISGLKVVDEIKAVEINRKQRMIRE